MLCSPQGAAGSILTWNPLTRNPHALPCQAGPEGKLQSFVADELDQLLKGAKDALTAAFPQQACAHWLIAMLHPPSGLPCKMLLSKRCICLKDAAYCLFAAAACKMDVYEECATDSSLEARTTARQL